MQEIYNVKTKKNEELKVENNRLKIYLCGPTVYDSVHIGNVRALIFFDMLARYFSYLKFDIDYISNITDIDDKIIKKAIDENKTYKEISQRYALEYLDLFKELNIKYPRKVLYATDHILDMENLVSNLIKKDKAYIVDGEVFFKVKEFSEYGQISGQSTAELRESGRIEKNAKKMDNLDFVLWKKTDEPNFKTKFSCGRPGWHTECAALNLSHFNDTIDIHGGGMDLKFPHHENENAQFKACTGKDLAKFYMYVGLIDLNNAKMSKSKGNIILASDIKKYTNPMAYRLLLLAHNYRQRINFSIDLLLQYGKEYEKIISAINKKSFECYFNGVNHDMINDEIFKLFIKNMENDFATQNIVTDIFDTVKKINKEVNLETALEYINTIVLILDILGIKTGKIEYDENDIKMYNDWLDKKNKKEFLKADEIRTNLIKRGILS